MEYVGIDETNEHEGETWAHLVPKCPKAEAALKEFLRLYQDAQREMLKEHGEEDYDPEYDCELQWIEEPVSQEEIDIINKWCDPGYMSRLNVYDPPKQGWDAWIEEMRQLTKWEDFCKTFYKGPNW